eukprot:508598_1
MIEKSFQQNYEQMINSNNNIAMDKYIINMMKSYIRPNSQFTPFMIYYGTPDGKFLGNTKQLQHLRRDKSTDFDRQFYPVIEGDIVDYNNILISQDLYDPRCRPWYDVALHKSFTGDMNTAYPNKSFKNFYYDIYSPSLTQNCDAAKKAVMDLYNIYQNNSNNFEDMSKSKYIK